MRPNVDKNMVRNCFFSFGEFGENSFLTIQIVIIIAINNNMFVKIV